MSAATVAIDTNVLVRFLMADDPLQAKQARRLVECCKILVTPTVLLETEWVLRSGYQCKPQDIATYFHAFLGLPGVEVSEPEAVVEALQNYVAGMDFADALHLTLSKGAPTFVTFDRRLIRKAQKLSSRDLRQPQELIAGSRSGAS